MTTLHSKTARATHVYFDAERILKEATELYLEESPLPNVGRPLVTTFEATYAA